MRAHLGERGERLAALVRAGQDSGELDASVPPDAVAHLSMLLALGSALVPPDLHGVDPDAWTDLLGRLVAALAPQDIRERQGAAR